MPRGPRPQPITLTDDEQDKLDTWANRPTTQQRLATRARIVLAAAAGQSNAAIAADLGLTLPTVRKWRSRFATARLDGLADEPRPGAPRTVTDAQLERALAPALVNPEGAWENFFEDGAGLLSRRWTDFLQLLSIPLIRYTLGLADLFSRPFEDG